ncbi:MAG TPA: NAD(P)/FAD-dependent oxidoreductase, partial [Candidatus Dormibacteraeota bacterium]|nr:NAD(P)/FAD-dependent oxidoreductase [Candidatus Dormibacteraeota bacterium]
MPTLIASGARKHVVIMGAGPAGLTAAYELMKHDVPVTVVEKDPHQVGGLARTVEHSGYRFDIGGHRFFSKNQEVEDLWTEILGDEMLTRGRLSRIYYRGRFFAYPIKAANALWNLGPVEAARCLASYTWARIHPVRDPKTLEDWVRNQFGRRLFTIFFKTYTEKVWGISTKELSADWAAQRIKSLDLWVVLRTALLPHRKAKGRGEIVTTLIDRFRYPRRGPGQMWERVAEIAEERGQPVLLGRAVSAITHDRGKVTSITTTDAAGDSETFSGSHFISSIPIRELVARLDPPAPATVRQAADNLGYRDFISIALIIDRAEVFPDNWIYIHDPGVRVGRIQNFKNWSPDMVPDQSKTCLGLEYFCFEGDGLWTAKDADLIELAKEELERLGICAASEVFDGVVVR